MKTAKRLESIIKLTQVLETLSVENVSSFPLKETVDEIEKQIYVLIYPDNHLDQKAIARFDEKNLFDERTLIALDRYVFTLLNKWHSLYNDEKAIETWSFALIETELKRIVNLFHDHWHLVRYKALHNQMDAFLTIIEYGQSQENSNISNLNDQILPSRAANDENNDIFLDEWAA